MSAKDSAILDSLLRTSATHDREIAALTRAAAVAKAMESGEWRLVPVEATGDMTRAADAEDDKAYCGGSQHGATVEDHWNAMIAAAPTFTEDRGERVGGENHG